MHNKKTAYALARLPIGFSFFGHGLVRIPKISGFAEGMAQTFSQTILPHSLVLGFGFILPLIELFLGLFLIAGLFMRKTAATGVMLICVLILGSSLQENWGGVATQMFYGLYFVLLYLFAEYNSFTPLKRTN